MTRTTITISRTVAATPSSAFAAWVTPDELARWWWPHLPDTTYELDPVPGGTFVIDSPTAGIRVRGTYRAVEAPTRLAFSWIWANDGNDATVDGQPVVDEVEVVFGERLDGRTDVTVRHSSSQHISGGGAEQGWNDVMDRLPGHQ